jgi:hypothetical protein
VAAGFALRIDALHGETGQELHSFCLRGRKAHIDLKCGRPSVTTKSSEFPLVTKTSCEKGPDISCTKIGAQANVMAGIVALAACGVKRKDYKILW